MLAQPRSNETRLPGPGTVSVACASKCPTRALDQCRAVVVVVDEDDVAVAGTSARSRERDGATHPNCGATSGAGPMLALSDTAATS